MIRRIITLCLVVVLTSCTESKEAEIFNLRIDGVPVFYFQEIESVYRMGDGKLMLPVSNESYRNLNEFMGDVDSIELDLFIGENKLTAVTIPKLSSRALEDEDNALALYSNLTDIEALLEKSGVKVKN